MEVLMSNWPYIQSVPERYVLPSERRPGEVPVAVAEDIPVIDLDKTNGPDRAETIQELLKACEEVGLFQVINHGIPKSLMDETMEVFKEFFRLPADYKAQFLSNTRDKTCILYSSSLNHENTKEEVRYWRDCFTHHCHPLQDHQQFWPDTPARYREVVGKYSVEARKFLLRVCDLIGEGLGVEEGYFGGELSKTQLLSVNHHIPCPDPSVTLGHPEHTDPNLVTTLQQCQVPGLQTLKDGKWVGVKPLANAFVVVLGVQFRVISNGKFTSPIHRVVTNAKEHRTTLGTFFIPRDDTLIEPAKALLGPSNPPIYRSYKYTDFFSGWTKQVAQEAALQRFKLQPSTTAQ
ncbi:Hyoscyamine (6S)-dioxygenase [Bertholletia excelsa]